MSESRCQPRQLKERERLDRGSSLLPLTRVILPFEIGDQYRIDESARSMALETVFSVLLLALNIISVLSSCFL